MRATPEFMTLLAGWDLASLEQEDGSVFGLMSDLTLAMTSGGWSRFANENNGEATLKHFVLGTSVMLAIPAPLRPFYLRIYTSALNNDVVVQHLYDCSSPQRYRRFRMTLYPLAGGEGLLVINTLIKSVPHPPGISPPSALADFVTSGFLTQCCHCRRFKANVAHAIDGQWFWIAEWLTDPPMNISHGLCVPCAEHYYPA